MSFVRGRGTLRQFPGHSFAWATEAGFALISLVFARLIPLAPAPGNESVLAYPAPQAAE